MADLDFSTLEFGAIRLFEREVTDTMDKLEPLLKKAYKKLKKRKYVYDLEKTRMENISDNLLYVHDIYVGIVKGCKRGDMIYISAENAKFLILFNDKRYIDEHDSIINKGLQVYQVYGEVDIDCIEKAWNVDSTTKWVTKLDLARECFTDESEHSQVIKRDDGEEDLIVCHRPTIKRVISDLNKGYCNFYAPIYTRGGRSVDRTCGDIPLINYAYRMMVVLCMRLEIPGCDI